MRPTSIPLIRQLGLVALVSLATLGSSVSSAPEDKERRPPAHSLTLAWDDTVNTGLDSYTIHRRKNNTGAAWVLLAATDPTTRMYTDTSLRKNDAVCYVARAVRGTETSGTSNEVCATTP